jgi:hypothetical protein
MRRIIVLSYFFFSVPVTAQETSASPFPARVQPGVRGPRLAVGSIHAGEHPLATAAASRNGE